ncbi:MAG: acyl-CoA thioesterase [Pseudohongiellaceae bacterium]|nr:acyl-CoA thioesterase [Pseudohongiellaceae bacterium]
MNDFSVSMAVRDYECDMQGIVNNAVYQNYLEHARHEFLKSKGLDFAELTAAGINVVVLKAELDYLSSLASGDVFTINVRLVKESRLKVVFQQEILRQSDQKQIMKARITATAVNERGRPYFPDELQRLLE